MSKKGGYKIIDLKHTDFLSLEVGVVLAGIYASIESSYNKPLMLSGIVIDGVEKNDVYIEELKVVDGSFVFKAYGYEITIDDEDNVDAVEIHVPVVKSVTSSATSKDIDILDGDEYLLSSTNEDGTIFKLPKECYLVGELNFIVNSSGASDGITNHINNETKIVVLQNKEIYIKRLKNMILVTTPYEI